MVNTDKSPDQSINTDGEWISVEERLPEEFKEVLIYEKWADYPCVAFWRDGGWIAAKDFFECVGNAYIVDNIDQLNVTHWMPLPDPPEVKE